MSLTLRPAVDADAPILTAIHLAARVSAEIPNLHDEADVTAFHHRLIATAHVRVAEIDGAPVAYASVRDGWLEQLWVLPAYHRRGIGRALLSWARRFGELHLYVFTHNLRARAFYAAHGAEQVAETDGSTNEERLPDLTLRFPAPA
jgi:GNAT superfamily N-acetyltransferase